MSTPSPGDARDRVTTVGLIVEAATGLLRILSPTLEAELGVSGKSFSILFRLQRTPGGALRMSDLAAQTGFTPSGLTRAVDRLEQAGLVRRVDCPGDRRGAAAQLTELGVARTDKIMAQHRRDIDELFDSMLEPEDEAALTRLTRIVRDRVHPGAAHTTRALQAR